MPYEETWESTTQEQILLVYERSVGRCRHLGHLSGQKSLVQYPSSPSAAHNSQKNCAKTEMSSGLIWTGIKALSPNSIKANLLGVFLFYWRVWCSSHLYVITLADQQVSQSSEVWLLRDTDCPHYVSVTGPWNPACHHNHHVARLVESSCFPWWGGWRETKVVCE